MSLEIWLDLSGYVSRGIEKNPENLDRRDLCREVLRGVETAIELVSRSRETRIFKGEKTL